MSGILDPVFSSITDPQGDILQINSDGSVSNAYTDGIKNTYSAASALISLPTLATDIFTVFGSATKTIRILRVEVTGIQTTAGSVPIILVKRLSQDTGGTIAALNVGIPHDSNNPNFTATVTRYSANPASLGITTFVRTTYIFLPAAASVSAPTYLIWGFTDVAGQALVLRGVNEGIAINMNGATITGGQMFVNVEWTEE